MNSLKRIQVATSKNEFDLYQLLQKIFKLLRLSFTKCHVTIH